MFLTQILILILLTLPSLNAQSEEYKVAEKSEVKTLFYDDENYGSIKFTYYTFQSGELGLPLSYLHGTIEITDKNYPTVECNPNDIDWSVDPPVCKTKTTWKPRIWNDTNQVRIAMEFGQPDKASYQKYREQLRFIRHVDSTSWDQVTQSIKDFNIWDDDIKQEVYKFITIPEDDYDRLDISGLVGFRVLGGSLDKDARKAKIEFIRPFDVSRDDALTLEGGQKYQLWLQWGVFKDQYDDDQERVKGMRTYIQKNLFEDHSGVLWEIQDPPKIPIPEYNDASASHSRSLSPLWIVSSISLLISCTFFHF